MVMVAGRAGAGARGSRAACHAGIQPVGQWLLERGHCSRGHSRLPVVQVGGGRCAACARHAAPSGDATRAPRSAGRVRPTSVGRSAVQPLKRSVVACLGQQFQAHCCLTFPFGPAQHNNTNRIRKRYCQC